MIPLIGRLIEELSWEGRSIKNYRGGGRGKENILTAEVFNSLNGLPRDPYLKAVIENSTGSNIAKEALIKELELLNFDLLPGNNPLIKNKNHQEGMSVQPDGWIEGGKVICLMEAKRIKKPSEFQKQQLARELFLVHKKKNDKSPVFWLILGKEPPVSVKGLGRLSIREAVEAELQNVIDAADPIDTSYEEMVVSLEDNLLISTWDGIKQSVNRLELPNEDSSLVHMVKRNVIELNEIIESHK